MLAASSMCTTLTEKFSYDLSSAKDCFPIDFQFSVVEQLFGEQLRMLGCMLG